MGIVGDVWQAGLDTTVATINWAILYAGLNQDVQKKIHDELDNVLGDQVNKLFISCNFSLFQSTKYLFD